MELMVDDHEDLLLSLIPTNQPTPIGLLLLTKGSLSHICNYLSVPELKSLRLLHPVANETISSHPCLVERVEGKLTYKWFQSCYGLQFHGDSGSGVTNEQRQYHHQHGHDPDRNPVQGQRTALIQWHKLKLHRFRFCRHSVLFRAYYINATAQLAKLTLQGFSLECSGLTFLLNEARQLHSLVLSNLILEDRTTTDTNSNPSKHNNRQKQQQHHPEPFKSPISPIKNVTFDKLNFVENCILNYLIQRIGTNLEALELSSCFGDNSRLTIYHRGEEDEAYCKFQKFLIIIIHRNRSSLKKFNLFEAHQKYQYNLLETITRHFPRLGVQQLGLKFSTSISSAKEENDDDDEKIANNEKNNLNTGLQDLAHFFRIFSGHLVKLQLCPNLKASIDTDTLHFILHSFTDTLQYLDLVVPSRRWQTQILSLTRAIQSMQNLKLISIEERPCGDAENATSKKKYTNVKNSKRFRQPHNNNHREKTREKETSMDFTFLQHLPNTLKSLSIKNCTLSTNVFLIPKPITKVPSSFLCPTCSSCSNCNANANNNTFNNNSYFPEKTIPQQQQPQYYYQPAIRHALKNLSAFDMQGLRIPEINKLITLIFNEMAQLQTLYLSDCHVGDLELAGFTKLEVNGIMRRLKNKTDGEIERYLNPIICCDGARPKFLSRLKCLRKLDISFNSTVGIGTIVEICRMPQLVKLNLDGCTGVTDICLKLVAQWNTCLIDLNVCKCPKITNFGINQLIQRRTSLTRLMVSKKKRQISSTEVNELFHRIVRYTNEEEDGEYDELEDLKP